MGKFFRKEKIAELGLRISLDWSVASLFEMDVVIFAYANYTCNVKSWVFARSKTRTVIWIMRAFAHGSVAVEVGGEGGEA